jgi:phosphoribosylformimino-5-aminoimidazole carboxamide ribotide isomerase
MMEIFPAIDLRGGQCVRLRQGDYHRETVFDADPVAVARRWVKQGASWLHIVDLDGAKEGRPKHQSVVLRITREVSAQVQFGGGLRDLECIEAILNLGVARVILGTRAIREPDWLEGVCRRFPNRIILSLDAQGMTLATHGWQQSSELQVLDVLARSAELPLAGFVYTDIQRDGMMAGPNWDALRAVRSACRQTLIASGGISSLADVAQLADMGLDGCIIGRALYDGSFDVAQAIAVGATASKTLMGS